MQPYNLERSRAIELIDPQWKNLCKTGAIAVLVFLVYSFITMALLITIGGPPETAAQGFEMLQENRITGILRLDVLTVFVIPLYYLIFLSIYLVLKDTFPAYATLATLLIFIGITLVLATPSAFSFLTLYDRYAAASDDAQRTLFLAAGEAVLASDMWHGSGALVGSLLSQTGAVLVSVLMLGNRAFSRATAYAGIATHSLDLAHVVLAFFLPGASLAVMAVAGTLYLLWFPLLARDLFRLGK